MQHYCNFVSDKMNKFGIILHKIGRSLLPKQVGSDSAFHYFRKILQTLQFYLNTAQVPGGKNRTQTPNFDLNLYEIHIMYIHLLLSESCWIRAQASLTAWPQTACSKMLFQLAFQNRGKYVFGVFTDVWRVKAAQCTDEVIVTIFISRVRDVSTTIRLDYILFHNY